MRVQPPSGACQRPKSLEFHHSCLLAWQVLARGAVGAAGLSRRNRSNRTVASWQGPLGAPEAAWVQRFYARDLADPFIAAALAGAVLKRDGGSGYVPLPGWPRQKQGPGPSFTAPIGGEAGGGEEVSGEAAW